MKKLTLMFLMVCILTFNLTGCSNASQSVDGVTQLKFKDSLSASKLKKLDNQSVTITGFMSTSTPLDGKYTYLMNLPYQNCAFCVPNTDTLQNTIAVYAPNGKNFEFTDVPVKITGTLKYETMTDSMGYTYNYRIVDATMEIADITGLEEEIKLYSDLMTRGFGGCMDTLFNELADVLRYEQIGNTVDDVKTLNMETFDEIDKMFADLDKEKYADILKIVDDIKALMIEINNSIEAKNLDNFLEYDNQANDMYNEYYNWLMKTEI